MGSKACEYDCDDPYGCSVSIATEIYQFNGVIMCTAYCCPSGGTGLPQAGGYYCSKQQTCPMPPSRAPTTAAPTPPTSSMPTTRAPVPTPKPTFSKAPTIENDYSKGCSYSCEFDGCGTNKVRQDLEINGVSKCVESCCPSGGYTLLNGNTMYCSIEQTCLVEPSRAPTQLQAGAPTQPTLRTN